ncbi:sialoadhesin-like [Misgurnus anguillicaudatus]|uniref:sialoadhesin-like n=1 Tax=Misgurnus anguillicaudatus TaxID=75329 RepID=UPI003CCF26F1
MSSRGTQERSSGPNPSQKTRYSSCPPWRPDSRNSHTVYTPISYSRGASSPGYLEGEPPAGGDELSPTPSHSPGINAAPKGLQRVPWTRGTIVISSRKKHCDPEMKRLIYLLFQGVLLYETLAWEVKLPTKISGLKGSCLVIPCSYSYTSNPPTNPHRVVWYQWVSKGFPLVYDPWYPDSVIDKFRGKTDLYNPTNSDRDCSLLIKSVNPSHSGEKVYAWIDPENIGWRTYKFYDVTSTIIVDTNPQQPIINIYGGLKTGDSITVVCYILHTCPYSKPNIILKGIEGSDKIDDVRMENGRWKITLTRTGVVKAERSDIECTVTHHGGRTATAMKSLSAKCVYYNITIEPKLAADIIEDVGMNFTCTVHHSCQKNPPILSWNYENMPVKHGKKQLTRFELATFSTITFLGTKKEDGKKLICTTNIPGQKITASVDLHVQHFSLQIILQSL